MKLSWLSIFLLIIFSIRSYATDTWSYRGKIGEKLVDLTIYDGGWVSVVYSYGNSQPFGLGGNQNYKELKLSGFEGENEVSMTLYNVTNDVVTGEWICDGKKLNVELKQTFKSIGVETSYDSHIYLQSDKTDQHYFKLIASQKQGEFPRVNGVEIYDIATDTLFQHIEGLDCEYRGDCVTVEDYNNDGVEDFSVFKESFAGPNTMRVYILFNSKKNQYFVSEIEGVSLDFEEGYATENNVCCGGFRQITTYKIVKNKLMQIDMRCYSPEGDEINCNKVGATE